MPQFAKGEDGMTTEEYLVARKSKNWKFNRVVDNASFDHVNKIHPIKQRAVKDIVDAEKEGIVVYEHNV